MVNVSGIYFNDSVVKNARKKEQAQNRNNTLKNVALIAATPVVAKQIVSKVDPSTKKVVVDVANKGIDGFWKALRYLDNNSKLFNKVTNVMSNFVNKPRVRNVLTSKFMKNILKPIIKIQEAFYVGNGKAVLKYGAIGLLTYGAYKIVANHYENKGAIKEKYSC